MFELEDISGKVNDYFALENFKNILTDWESGRLHGR